MLNQLLKKLIHTRGRNRNAMAVAGLFIALLLILSAVQIQANYQQLLYSKTSQDSIADFLVINKTVTDKNIGAATLSNAEINDLKQQPFVEKIGTLTPSRFKVGVQSISKQIPFYSDFFFESVPNEFLDVNTPAWQWNETSNYIPMIIPNMFLDMYNFGFAQSQHLPQLSQDLITSLPVQINIQTPTGVVNYYGKVVGFSDRISSVLVPQPFMNWANKKFGTDANQQPSRVIIQTNNASSPQLAAYLKAHNLSTNTEKTRFEKYRGIITTVVAISWAMGGLMFLFALIVLTLFIQLSIASAREEIYLLVTLGAAPKQLQRFLRRQFLPANIITVIITLVIVAALQFMLQKTLMPQNIFISPYLSVYTIVAAFIILLLIGYVNNRAIKKYIHYNN
ncbi:FtsX-like permease family protein [Parafilimonas sp.]|uniref:FtsX-like permease family protein n=1 Tax=Parafilimonas sp. TaxID=1969739 RepID=UPI0039E399C4